MARADWPDGWVLPLQPNRDGEGAVTLSTEQRLAPAKPSERPAVWVSLVTGSFGRGSLAVLTAYSFAQRRPHNPHDPPDRRPPMPNVVLYEERHSLAFITLNRPEKLNTPSTPTACLIRPSSARR